MANPSDDPKSHTQEHAVNAPPNNTVVVDDPMKVSSQGSIWSRSKGSDFVVIGSLRWLSFSLRRFFLSLLRYPFCSFFPLLLLRTLPTTSDWLMFAIKILRMIWLELATLVRRNLLPFPDFTRDWLSFTLTEPVSDGPSKADQKKAEELAKKMGV